MTLIVGFDDLQTKGTDSGGDIIYYYQNQPFTGIIAERINGILVGEAEFTNGHRGGIQRHYDTNSGQLLEEYTVHFNKLEGHFKEWDNNGTLISHTGWQNGNCIQIIL
jgi:antitoxin component YwqK of YwqJK toxin-antitoxin module